MGEDEKAAVEARTRAAIEGYVKAWATNDKEALLNVFAEDAIWIDPVGTPAWEGRARIAEFWEMAHQGGAVLEPRVQRIVVCGNEGILLFRMVVRFGGGAGGMGIDACDQMIVNDEGRIASGKAYWDQGCVVPLDQC